MRTSILFFASSCMIGCTFTQEFQLPGDRGGGSSGDLNPWSEAGCGADSDPHNCGTCGHSCLGGACAGGRCQPVVLASGQGDSAWYAFNSDIGDPLEGPDRIAVDGSHVYWLNLRGEVMRVPISGGETEPVATTKPGPSWIALDEEFVYFSTLGAEIFRVPKTGGSPMLLGSGDPPAIFLTGWVPHPIEFLLAGGLIYWPTVEGIVACPMSGCSGAPQVINPGSADDRPFSFAIGAGARMYTGVELHYADGEIGWAMTVFHEGQWLGLAGSNTYYELHGEQDAIYAFSTSFFGPTGVVRRTESSVTFLASGDAVPPAPQGLALDEGFVYWANAAAFESDRRKRTASVVRCSKNGCVSPEVLADEQIVPRAVAASGDAVYWTTGDGNVMKLAKPGSAEPPPTP